MILLALVAVAILMAVCLIGITVRISGLVMDPSDQLDRGEMLVPLLCLLAGKQASRRLHQILENRAAPQIVMRDAVLDPAALNAFSTRLEKALLDPHRNRMTEAEIVTLVERAVARNRKENTR